MIKKYLIYIIVSLFFLPLFFSCEEIAPDINFKEGALSETTFVDPVIPIPQSKMVLLEDLTGVRCVNCPKADTLSKDILNNNPGRVIVIQLHRDDDNFTYPYEIEWGIPNSETYDLRTKEAKTIETTTGVPAGKPAGYIDRVFFSGESNRWFFTNKWESYVSDRLNETTPVNINIETEWDAPNRIVKAIIQVHYTNEITNSHSLSISIIEDSVFTAQLTPVGLDSNYMHNHVLRSMITATTGDLLAFEQGSKYEQGRKYIKIYSDTLASHWNVDNCEIIAFIHKNSSDTLDVVHAAKEEIIK
ncbi:Omp28-related outer membrane protein [Candidatus Amoebophilus asiaticus]|nr:Omp28-related outer membrane protein [Candidatus Amoebophilus asiaticus]